MDRWEELKPTIEQLYLGEKRKLADVVAIMKRDFGFDAVDHQYKHHFKKWKWKKNIPTTKKIEIVEQLESRARAGKSGTVVRWQGKAAEPHKIRRYMKGKMRAESSAVSLHRPNAAGPVLEFSNSIFLKWNLPYAALRQLHLRPFDHSSPLGFTVPTPGSNISVDSPPGASPPNAPSPTTVLVKKKTAIKRAHLFAQGQLDALNQSMDGEERRVMSDWLYQYWFFCFKTAKNWGRGPRNWTAEMLDFASFSPQLRPSLPGTPNDSNQRHNDQGQSEVPHPTDLCRWLIHVSPDSGEHYEQVEEEEVIQDPGWQDPQDESTWSPWPREWQEPPLPARLRDALEHTDFSNIPSAALPVAVPEISKAAQRSPDELILESLGFSVMSRNLGQVEVLLRKVSAQKLDFASLYPFHLATSYLDGYKTCCEVLAILLAHGRDLKFREMYENELGHTVLDNLMISVLKSHSSSTPAVIDESVKDKLRFAGEEVDICGRWDADSPCMRHLLAQGNPSTPFTWKHKFCHTSTQTICHCFITISQSISSSFLWDTPSGLYVRRCFNCGMKLQLLPLHALVMTAYHLANNSCDDEDLFGMLALLLCFISRRADPRVSADISVSALLKKDMPELACDHIKQNAAELAEHISMESTVTSWSSNTRIGWDVFCGVLRLCVDSWPDSSEDDESLSDDDPIEENVILGEWDSKLMDMHLEIHDYTCLRHCKDLASLWASVQAEMLSYRRLDKDLSWISPNFSIEKLHRQLQNGEPIATPYMENGLLKAYCICGEFRGWPFATLPDVTDPNIANLDIWDRASYIPLREE